MQRAIRQVKIKTAYLSARDFRIAVRRCASRGICQIYHDSGRRDGTEALCRARDRDCRCVATIRGGCGWTDGILPSGTRGGNGRVARHAHAETAGAVQNARYCLVLVERGTCPNVVCRGIGCRRLEREGIQAVFPDCRALVRDGGRNGRGLAVARACKSEGKDC